MLKRIFLTLTLILLPLSFAVNAATEKETETTTVTAVDRFKPINEEGFVKKEYAPVKTGSSLENCLPSYAEGTFVKLVAENKGYYKTLNNRYLQKDSVKLTDTFYGSNKLTAITYDEKGFSLNMGRATEYSAKLTSTDFELTLFDTALKEKSVIKADNKMFSYLDHKYYPSKKTPRLDLKFRLSKKDAFIGYNISFEDNIMRVDFNKKTEDIKILLDCENEKTASLLKQKLENSGFEVLTANKEDTNTAKLQYCLSQSPAAFVSIKETIKQEPAILYTTSTPLAEKTASATSYPLKQQPQTLNSTTFCPCFIVEIPTEDSTTVKKTTEYIASSFEEYFKGTSKKS